MTDWARIVFITQPLQRPPLDLKILACVNWPSCGRMMDGRCRLVSRSVLCPCVWELEASCQGPRVTRCPCMRTTTSNPHGVHHVTTKNQKPCSQQRPKILFPGRRSTSIRKHKRALCNPSSPRQMTCGAGKDRIQVPKGLLASSGITSTRRWTSLCTDDRISLLRHHCKAWSTVQCISKAGLGSNITSGRMSAENPIHLKRKCARHELSLSAARMCI